MEPEVYRHAVELGKPPFGKTPERFDAVDMAMAVTGKLMYTVVDPKMAGVSDIDQAIVTAPAITVNDAFNRYLSENNRL